MRILSFGVRSVFEFSAYERMNGTTNLAVVDLSPCGFVFKELALQSLILNAFLSFLFFCPLGFYGGLTPHKIFQFYLYLNAFLVNVHF